MRRFSRHLAIVLVATLCLAAPLYAQGTDVGRFTQVLGQVDILKASKLPAAAVKVGDGVRVGDMIRTKSESKAEIQFIDDTTIQIAPTSRVVIDKYAYDGANQRDAGLKLMLGMVYTVVNKLFKKDTPDFTIETETAVIGVRGTRTFVLKVPGASDVYNEQGWVQGRNINPSIVGLVYAYAMQFFRVPENQPPTVPVGFSPDDLRNLRQMLGTGLSGRITQPGQGMPSQPFRGLQVRPGTDAGLAPGLPGGVTIPTIPPQPKVVPHTPPPSPPPPPPPPPPAPQPTYTPPIYFHGS